MGWAHDHFGTYRPMAYVFGAALVIATLCIALLGPYAYASRKALARDTRLAPADNAATASR